MNSNTVPSSSQLASFFGQLPPVCAYPNGTSIKLPLGACKDADCVSAILCKEKSKIGRCAIANANKVLSNIAIQSLMEYSAAVYCDNVQRWECNNCLDNSKLSEITEIVNQDTDTHGFVGVNHKTSSIVVAFRGSTSARNWQTNFDTEPFSVKDRYLQGQSIALHRGFYNAANRVYADVNKSVQRLRGKFPNYKLQLTGHSLGGALALTTAFLVLKNDDYDKKFMEVVAFAPPKLFNEGLANYMRKKGVSINIIFNKDDWVPKSPSDEYHHVGNLISYQKLVQNPCIFKRNGKVCKDDQVRRFLREHNTSHTGPATWNLHHSTIGGFVFESYCASGEGYMDKDIPQQIYGHLQPIDRYS